MSALHIMQTVFEFVMIALIILCVIYEPILVKWEEKQKEKILKVFNDRKRYRK